MASTLRSAGLGQSAFFLGQEMSSFKQMRAAPFVHNVKLELGFSAIAGFVPLKRSEHPAEDCTGLQIFELAGYF